MNPSRRSSCLVLAALVLFVAAPATAQERYANLYNKLEFSGSVTSAILNTNIRFDSKDGSFGTEFDAEDDLGLQKVKYEPRLAVRWRPGRKHEIEGGYQWARRTADRTLDRTITIRDTTFDVGANIRSALNTDLAFVNYRYAIIAKEKTQAGVGIGLGALLLDANVDALASAGSSTVEYSAGEKMTVPVGAFGIYGRFILGDRWWSEADARIVKLQVDRFDIQFAQLNGAVRYFASRQWGVELGAGADAAKVDIDPRENARIQPSGRVKYSLTNVRLGVVFVK